MLELHQQNAVFGGPFSFPWVSQTITLVLLRVVLTNPYGLSCREALYSIPVGLMVLQGALLLFFLLCLRRPVQTSLH